MCIYTHTHIFMLNAINHSLSIWQHYHKYNFILYLFVTVHGNFCNMLWLFYSNVCHNTTDMVNHAVLAVGYAQEDETPYWIVKNSWGTSWGINGSVCRTLSNKRDFLKCYATVRLKNKIEIINEHLSKLSSHKCHF